MALVVNVASRLLAPVVALSEYRLPLVSTLWTKLPPQVMVPAACACFGK